jgi:glycerophosphoryl diester phosphodiesterase
MTGKDLGTARSPSVIAHRGFSGRYPENTGQAFAAAIAAGADMIELDARRTAGNRVAVVHDDDLARYGHPGMRVAGLDFEVLSRLDAGSWFDSRFAEARFLGLKEALELIAGRIWVNVEIKIDEDQEPHLEALVDSTLAEIEAAGAPPVLFSTFSMPTFRRLRARAPAIPAAYLQGRGDARGNLPELADLGAEGVHVARDLADSRLIRAAHAQNLRVRVYTINDPQGMAELIRLEVDGLFTDWPDRLLALLGRGDQRGGGVVGGGVGGGGVGGGVAGGQRPVG